MENIYNVAIPEPKTEGAVLTVKDGHWQLGSDGLGVFYITETEESLGSYTLSASYNDIVAAVEAGKMPIIISTGDRMQFRYILYIQEIEDEGYFLNAWNLISDEPTTYTATDPDAPFATPESDDDEGGGEVG